VRPRPRAPADYRNVITLRDCNTALRDGHTVPCPGGPSAVRWRGFSLQRCLLQPVIERSCDWRREVRQKWEMTFGSFAKCLIWLFFTFVAFFA
jgi:hypothetical protein